MLLGNKLFAKLRMVLAEIMDIRSAGEMFGHFDDVAAVNGLQRIVVED